MVTISRRQALGTIMSLAGVPMLNLSGCMINPVTGKRELMLMSEQNEIQMGAQAHPEIIASYGSYGDTAVQNWFAGRGQEMAKVTHRPNLTYHFTVLDSPVVNAFAVPGGYVYVTRGIMAYFNNEAQFAGVLAHELGHVNARHTAANYSKAQLANLGLGIGTIFSEEFAKYADLVSLGTTLMFLKFSRDDEREADKLGVQYSCALGYDAVQMSEFFITLERMTPQGGSLPAWQSTHPDPGDRIAATKKMALAFQQSHTGMKFVAKREEYLNLVNGIVYGDDPRQGYVKDSMFYHPGMKFQFPVPAGWKVTNQPSEVRMGPEKQEALIIFTVVPGSSPSDAAAKFAEGNKVAITDSRAVTINGMQGQRIVGSMTSGENQLALISSFIAKDSTIFAFHGICAPGSVGAYSTVFETISAGFNRLTNKTLINVSPKKIEVRAAKGSGTVQDALQKFSVPAADRDKLALLNGVTLKDSLPNGTRLKLFH